MLKKVRVRVFLVMTAATNPAPEREPVNAWDKLLDLVKSRVSMNTYTTWFQPTRLNRADGETLYVQIPSTVFRQVLTRTYGDLVCRLLLEKKKKNRLLNLGTTHR